MFGSLTIVYDWADLIEFSFGLTASIGLFWFEFAGIMNLLHCPGEKTGLKFSSTMII
jgi:hypothetical protein